MVLSRPVVAFALLSQCSELLRTDLVGGISVLVGPLIKGLAGQRFSADVLSKKLAEAYGVAINARAVEDLLPRFEQAGLVEVRKLSESASEAVFKEVELPDDIPYERDFEAFLRKFVSFAQERLTIVGVNVSEEELITGLLTRLATYSFSAINAKPDRSERDHATESKILGPTAKHDISLERALTPEARIDVLVASFLSRVAEDDPDATELIAKVAEGALGAELVFDLRAPQIKTDLSQVTVVLDTPLILSLLDLSDRQHHKLASNLVTQVREAKASLAVFQHSIDEAEGVLAAVKNGLRFGDAYGPTAERMRESSYQAFFHTMVGAVERRLKDSGFRVIPPTRDLAFQHFTKSDEDSLTNYLHFGQVDNRLARERDSRSVAETLRLRGGARVVPEHIELCRYVFITSNPVLEKQARGFLDSRRLVDRGEFPPIITDRTFCGLAWLLFGGSTSEGLPTAKLLANCANALRSRPDVIKKTRAFLERVDATKAKHFEALMTNERAARYLTEISLGDSVLITAENAEGIYERLEAVAGEKAARAKDEYYGKVIAHAEERLQSLQRELAETSTKRDEVLEQLGRAQGEGELRAAEAELFRRQLDQQGADSREQMQAIGHLTGQVGQLVQEVSRSATTLATLKENAVRRCALDTRSRLRRVQFGVLAVFLAVSFALGYLDRFVLPLVDPGQAKLGNFLFIAIQVAVAGMGFWVFSDRLIGRPVHAHASRYFQQRLLDLGYDDPGPEFSILDDFEVKKLS